MKLPTALHFFSKIVPSEIIRNCLMCTSHDVFSFDGDVFCNPCGWNSIEARIQNQFNEMAKKHEEMTAENVSAGAPSDFRQFLIQRLNPAIA